MFKEEIIVDVNKAKEVAKVMNRIEKCESFLKSLKGKSYNDEFTIYYRGLETCELEEEALQLLIEHYEDELVKLKATLKNL